MGGFTLIEIVVVLAVLTLLTGIAMPMVGATLRSADMAENSSEMASIRAAVINFYKDSSIFPGNLDDLVTDPGGLSSWQGPYISVGLGSSPADDFRYDVWRKAYQIVNAGSSSITLRSWGENKLNDNGGGDDIDLVIEAGPILRERNQRRLDAINAAILSYNRYFRIAYTPPRGRRQQQGTVTDIPLQGPWAGVLSKLRQKNLLPNDTIYDTDVWGNAFVCGPNPVQYVTTSGP